MQYQESIKEKKYKPLFGYGYEPRIVNRRTSRKDMQELRCDAFGNVIYDLPVEAEADIPEASEQEAGADVLSERAEENHFPKPVESPLMSIIVAVTIAIALFLTAVIMSLTNAPDTVRLDRYQNQMVTDLCVAERE